jgi:P27 family predicted phage terminase small subunit
MGERGPPPTPTNVLAMRGSWRANRNPGEPHPERGRPRCPRWLDEKAKEAWAQLIPQLDRMGVLAKIDGNALARYCQLWSRWRKAEDFLQQQGDTYLVKGPDGKATAVKAYPQARIAAQLAEQLLRLEQHFGMTPAARARLSAPREEPQQDDLRSRYLRVGG